MTGSRMSLYARGARRAAGRVRRRLGGSPGAAARLAETERALEKTRGRLRAARAEARELRAELERLHTEAERRAGPLPAEVEATIDRVRDEHLTYLKPGHLRALASAVAEVERDGLPGVLVEAGTARGGSAIVIAAAKARERPLKVYDVFGMIPPPSDRDGADVHKRYEKIAGGRATGPGGDTYYGYRDDLYEEVAESFRRHGVAPEEHGVELIRGLFQHTIELDEPVAFAHLDGDWYESTMTCLTRLAPLLVPGGRIVLDDYYAWSGCRSAVDEYFEGRDGFRLEHRAKLHVVRE